MLEKHVFGPFKHGVAAMMQRTDLEFYGVNQFRPSYVALIFFNDESVDVENASQDRDSYAGSFALFGHQKCFGDEGHCEIHPPTNRFDDRPSHPLTRGFKRVIVTDAMRRCLATEELTITVIVSTDPEAVVEAEGPLLDFLGLQIAAFE
jgi:hypothetical protein